MGKFVSTLIVTCTSIAQIELEAKTEEAAIAAARAMVADNKIYMLCEGLEFSIRIPEGVECLSHEQDHAEIAVVENTTAELEQGGAGEKEKLTVEKRKLRIDVNIYDASDDDRHLSYGDEDSFEVEIEVDSDGDDCHEEKTALEVMRLWATDYLKAFPVLEADRLGREAIK